MFEIAAIPAILNGAKSAVDVLAGVKSLKEDPEAKAALDTVERALLEARAYAGEAQLREMQLSPRLRELQAKVDGDTAWRSKLEMYEEIEYGRGKSAYQLKAGHTSSSHARYACPKCMGDKRISHLQFQNRTYQDLDFYNCYDCAGEFFYGTSNGDSGIRTVSSRDWNPLDY